ncbi:MAG: M48 family metallopeptidase [Rickettsiales bacterium]|jgi:predicted metal-dependent hydrolase|nr:M48 family metallopeptidase [Rickettsiales bacterium]
MISHTLIREKRKTLAICVLPNETIVVKAPLRATSFEINNFLQKKHKWLAKQLERFQQLKQAGECNANDEAKMLYLGEWHQIIVKKGIMECVEIDKNSIIVYSVFPDKKERIKNILQNWLTKQTEEQFTIAMNECIKKFPNMGMPKLKIRKLKRRWGSFLSKGTVILNSALIHASKQCIEYVICHEFCHFYHRNHSSSFYNLLTLKLPNWKEFKKVLEVIQVAISL